jgi:Flp pilus assembly protein TadG
MRQLLKRRLAASSEGQAVVETGLILSLILLLSLATFDLGRGISAHIALREATQEGALYAGYRYGDPDVTVGQPQIQARVRTSSSVDAVTLAEVTVPNCAPAPGYVTVRSTYELPVLMPIANFIFGPTLTLTVEVNAVNLNEGCT